MSLLSCAALLDALETIGLTAHSSRHAETTAKMRVRRRIRPGVRRVALRPCARWTACAGWTRRPVRTRRARAPPGRSRAARAPPEPRDAEQSPRVACGR